MTDTPESGPEPGPSPETPGTSTQDLVERLERMMYDGWTTATYTANFMGAVGESVLIYYLEGDAPYRVFGDQTWDADEIAFRLRAESHTPETGPWYRLTVEMKRGEEPKVTRVFGEIPAWDHEIPEEQFQRDLELYPRDDAAIPALLREKAGLGPAPEGTGPRLAKVFDGTQPGSGFPIVERAGLEDGETPRLLAYLKAGPVFLFAHSYDQDAYYPENPPSVPLTFATDGTWIWAGAVAYYLEKYGMPPEDEFLAHIRRRNYVPPDVSDQAVEAARVRMTTDMTASP